MRADLLDSARPQSVHLLQKITIAWIKMASHAAADLFSSLVLIRQWFAMPRMGRDSACGRVFFRYYRRQRMAFSQRRVSKFPE
jgi:hypothetical protein